MRFLKRKHYLRVCTVVFQLALSLAAETCPAINERSCQQDSNSLKPKEYIKHNRNLRTEESSQNNQTISKSCLKFNHEKFKSGPSIVTYFPFGRLGNTISSYLTLMWLKIDHGLDVYIERSSLELLKKIFQNLDGNIKVLEDELCDWKEFGFINFERNIDLLAEPEWRIGKAINIHTDTEEMKRNQFQSARKFRNLYRRENREFLTFKPNLQSYAQKVLSNIAEKLQKPPSEVTFVGIHNRRTDYLEFRSNVLKKKKLYKNFFRDGIEYFNEEYKNPVFVYISDDMKWGKKKLKNIDSVFFVGCGNGDDYDCVGKDLAVLGSCNHTIVTDGSFGFWGSIFAGGEIFTEYGVIVPQTFTYGN